MALYALSDLHLCFSVDKPMDVFGDQWKDYPARIEENWRKTVKPEDTVLIAGDISWATYISQAHDDFAFIHALPGTKIVSKGNHDYWWETVSKLNQYLLAEGFTSIRFLHNNCFAAGDVAICGAKGYITPDVGASDEDRKFYARELARLELSLQMGQKTACGTRIAMLHYPPVPGSGFIDLMKRYGVSTCIYGHLHGHAANGALQGLHEGIDFRLTAADYLRFQPIKLMD